MTAARAALGIAATFVLTLIGCGGGSPDALKIYSGAGEKMAALASYQAVGEIAGEEPEHLEIVLLGPDKFQVSISAGDEGGTAEEEFSLIGIGQQFYLKPPGSADYFISPPDEELPEQNVAAFLLALTADLSDLTYVGKEVVDGVSTHHLSGVMPLEVIQLVDVEETESLPVELWVGVEDSLVRRYRWTEKDSTVTMTVSRFNDETISIVAPANPRPAGDLLGEQIRQDIEELSEAAKECLRGLLGEDVFRELEAGTRAPAEEDLEKFGECLRDNSRQ